MPQIQLKYLKYKNNCSIKKEKYCIGVFQVPIKDLRNVGKTGFIEENQINENLIKLSSLLCEILEAILQ